MNELCLEKNVWHVEAEKEKEKMEVRRSEEDFLKHPTHPINTVTQVNFLWMWKQIRF